jgi:hypothetical protein
MKRRFALTLDCRVLLAWTACSAGQRDHGGTSDPERAAGEFVEAMSKDDSPVPLRASTPP